MSDKKMSVAEALDFVAEAARCWCGDQADEAITTLTAAITTADLKLIASMLDAPGAFRPESIAQQVKMLRQSALTAARAGDSNGRS